MITFMLSFFRYYTVFLLSFMRKHLHSDVYFDRLPCLEGKWLTLLAGAWLKYWKYLFLEKWRECNRFLTLLFAYPSTCNLSDAAYRRQVALFSQSYGSIQKRQWAMEIVIRREIRLLESNSKCCCLKKLTCKGTMQQVFISLRPPALFGLGW